MKAFIDLNRNTHIFGFTLVEMLMALLIVSVILSASLPVISQRQKAMASSYNQNRSFPIGGVILRGYGSLIHTQNNGSTIGNIATRHVSSAIGAVQGM